jgi:membrane associated rhomboid family serine protease
LKETISEINRALDRFLTPAVKIILVINVLFFFFLVLIQAVYQQGAAFLVLNLGHMPASAIFRFHIWQFLTFNFVHAEFPHLLFNMLGLFFFAPPLESRWGTRRFWHFYLFTGIGAGIFHALIALATGQTGALIIGASGAIYGVFLAFAAYYPDQPIYLFGVYPIKAKFLLAGMIFMTFLASANQSGSHIAHLTHLGGLIAGYIWLAIHHRDWDVRRWRWTRT